MAVHLEERSSWPYRQARWIFPSRRRHYERVAPALVPHLAGRPLTLGRFPDGIGGPGFARTECRGRPDRMRTFPIRLRSGDLRNYCLVDDARAPPVPRPRTCSSR